MKIILKNIEVKSRLIDDYTNSYIIQDIDTIIKHMKNIIIDGLLHERWLLFFRWSRC